jgi:hypothetical protein
MLFGYFVDFDIEDGGVIRIPRIVIKIWRGDFKGVRKGEDVQISVINWLIGMKMNRDSERKRLVPQNENDSGSDENLGQGISEVEKKQVHWGKRCAAEGGFGSILSDPSDPGAPQLLGGPICRFDSSGSDSHSELWYCVLIVTSSPEGSILTSQRITARSQRP